MLALLRVKTCKSAKFLNLYVKAFSFATRNYLDGAIKPKGERRYEAEKQQIGGSEYQMANGVDEDKSYFTASFYRVTHLIDENLPLT